MLQPSIQVLAVVLGDDYNWLAIIIHKRKIARTCWSNIIIIVHYHLSWIPDHPCLYTLCPSSQSRSSPFSSPVQTDPPFCSSPLTSICLSIHSQQSSPGRNYCSAVLVWPMLRPIAVLIPAQFQHRLAMRCNIVIILLLTVTELGMGIRQVFPNFRIHLNRNQLLVVRNK